jgi:hypothetical protein
LLPERLARDGQSRFKAGMADPLINYVSIEWILAFFHRMSSGVLFRHRNAKEKAYASFGADR